MKGLKGVQRICDGILVYGSGDTPEEAMADHDLNKTAILDQCREKGIKPNRDKLKF